MTKEELEKEAGEWLKSNIKTENREGITFNIVPTPVQIYLASAEPREKRIEELEAEVVRLRNENLDIINKYTRFAETDKRTIADLEAQIEKMKNWCNCKNYQQCLIELAEQGKGMKPSECCVNCKKWEIKEK